MLWRGWRLCWSHSGTELGTGFGAGMLGIKLLVFAHYHLNSLRLVTNSSSVDPETGLSLNSILAKGPMYLNDMWEILVRFRSYEAGLIGLLPNPDRASRVPLQKGSVEVWGGGRTLEDICL